MASWEAIMGDDDEVELGSDLAEVVVVTHDCFPTGHAVLLATGLNAFVRAKLRLAPLRCWEALLLVGCYRLRRSAAANCASVIAVLTVGAAPNSAWLCGCPPMISGTPPAQ